MSDLEWYLDVGGKQSGPHSAKEIVEMVRGGKISAAAQVTAARMNGDWVTAQDLIDAYDELYTKPAIAVPIEVSGGAAFTVGPADPNFTAPPRPTEQLEKSKIITLNRDEIERTPDPTEALFQAIQAVREKANQKGASAPPAGAAGARDTFGQLARPGGPRVPQPLVLIITLTAIFALTIYGVVKLVGGKKARQAVKAPIAEKRHVEPPPRHRAKPVGGLLNSDGSGESAARTLPPVRPVKPARIPPRMTGRTKPRDTRDDEKMNGGARYRDERDERDMDEPDRDVDVTDIDDRDREISEPMPVDPSQVPSDRIIPEPGSLPGRDGMPPEYPYEPPPGAAQ
jgi:hypothetical protein